MSTRLNININDETHVQLASAQMSSGVTATEVIRRAMSVYDFWRKAEANGSEVRVIDRNGDETKVKLL